MAALECVKSLTAPGLGCDILIRVSPKKSSGMLEVGGPSSCFFMASRAQEEPFFGRAVSAKTDDGRERETQLTTGHRTRKSTAKVGLVGPVATS